MMFAIAPETCTFGINGLPQDTQNPYMRTHANDLHGKPRLARFMRRPLMATGTVRFFNTQKGYGFIVQDNGGPDIFERAGMHNLNEGQKLSFDVQTDPRSGKSA